MKKKILLVPLLMLAIQSFSQDIVKIKGSCPTVKDGTEISLIKWLPRRFSSKNGKVVSKTVNHQFTFEVNAHSGEGFLLDANNRFTRIYLEPGVANIVIEDSLFNKVTVTGNTTGVEYSQFASSQHNSAETKAYNMARVNYYNYLETTNINIRIKENLKNKIDSLAELKSQKDVELAINHIKAKPSSLLNTFLLYDVIDIVPEDSIKHIFTKIKQKNTDNIWGKELRYRIDSLFTGSLAPTFEQTDTAGHKVNLKSFRGKYVLVDFWASWCIPCRADNPNLIRAYDRFKNKNFSIVSVSLDEDKERWLQAIQKDKLPWTHVSDLAGYGNEVSVKYYVYAVPDNFLINPDGKIIGRNLHGEELVKTLRSIL